MPTMNKDSDWETIIRQILKVKSPTMSLPILSCGKTAVKFFSNPRWIILEAIEYKWPFITFEI